MRTLDELYAIFPETDKATWIAQLEKDLKGQPWTNLRWELEPGITMDPFYMSDDQSALRSPLEGTRAHDTWAVGEGIEVDDPAAANKLALEALEGGANALDFRLMHKPTSETFSMLLEGINPAWAQLHFSAYYEDKALLHLLQLYIAYLKNQGVDLNQVRGSLDFDPLLDWVSPPMEDLAEAIRIGRAELPLFDVLRMNGTYYFAGPGASSTELGMILAKGAEYLARLQDLGIPAADAHASMQCSVAIGNSYFVAIAKLRALRILWNNLLAGFGVSDPTPLELVVHFAPESQDEHPHTNMIRAATQAMSAIIGGADVLFVLPADTSTQPQPDPFTRRIARNVQHLLRLESHFDKVIDPAAGSYYIETLTNQLAQAAWDKFVELDKNRAFG